MMKTPYTKSIEEVVAEAQTTTITHVLSFDKNKVSVDWDNDGNPVLVFQTNTVSITLPDSLKDGIIDFAVSLGIAQDDLLEPLYCAADRALAFNALKQAVLK